MQISVVIPTCNRKPRLLSLLQNLDNSLYPVNDVIIVDSGEDRLSSTDYSAFTKLNVQYVSSEKSVCIQRNKGIKMAGSEWIFLCDDDIEIPGDYLQKLVTHIKAHPEAGAVSGIWLEKENKNPIAIGWKATHPINSTRTLIWKYIFKQGIWGEINCKSNMLTKGIKKYYEQRGNHISKAGWPVNTDFNGNYVICPVYSLGASLIKKEWLLHSPYDEVLDRHGIGDNYGVAVEFPGIHVVNSTFVHHHLEPANRLKRSLQYYRRILALDYFIRTKRNLDSVKRRWLVWSLIGHIPGFIISGSWTMLKATFKAIGKIILNDNPFYKASKKGQKIIEPNL